MARRKITVEVEGDLGADLYADLTHAIWTVTNAVLPQQNFVVKHDSGVSSQTLQDRWVQYGKESRWEGTVDR